MKKEKKTKKWTDYGNQFDYMMDFPRRKLNNIYLKGTTQ